MSLDREWFSRAAKRHRQDKYTSFAPAQWEDALEEHVGVCQPIADEASAWLRDNKTPIQIFSEFGYSVLALYVEVSGDKLAAEFASQLPNEVKATYQTPMERVKKWRETQNAERTDLSADQTHADAYLRETGANAGTSDDAPLLIHSRGAKLKRRREMRGCLVILVAYIVIIAAIFYLIPALRGE